MTKEQETLVADLRRNGRSHTADRVAALGDMAFARFKRDLLQRFAADGVFA